MAFHSDMRYSPLCFVEMDLNSTIAVPQKKSANSKPKTSLTPLGKKREYSSLAVLVRLLDDSGLIRLLPRHRNRDSMILSYSFSASLLYSSTSLV